MVHHRRRRADGLEVFYREAGDPANPTLVLLHGFPSSSFMFRELLLLLQDDLHLIAPDLPGFGNTESPPPGQFEYTFDHLADVTLALLDELGIERYGLYVQDYGAPVGQRLAVRRPEAVEAVVVQNGNAYDEGFSDAWSPLRDGLWRERTPETEAAVVDAFISPAGIRANWTAGAREPEALSPDGPTMDGAYMALEHRREIQLELLHDYRHNPARYADFQRWLRERRPPVLITWGERDPYFTVAGARAFLRDQPDAELHLLPTGHFALEEELDTITALIRRFYQTAVDARA